MVYWSWWQGAIALASVTLAYWFAVGRPLGVSGCLARVISGSADADDQKFAKLAAENPDALTAALLAETMAQFPGHSAAPAAAPSAPVVLVAPVPRTAHAVFLASLAVGGLLATLTAGRPLAFHTSMGPSFERLFHQGWQGALGLVVGGVLVGFGTRMAGGCTSGHGLSGVSRLQPGSLLATGVFFGAAIVTALVLHQVMG